jgi:hypothetical protein
VETLDVRPVGDQEWGTLAWLWQCFRHDLAPFVSALPYADGRYQTSGLPQAPSADTAAYLAWRPHPSTGEAAPVGFAVVDGLREPRRSVDAFWVAPVLRGTRAGRVLALDVLARHPGPWTIAYQRDNALAGRFWRRVADLAFGADGWTEEIRPVPGRPDVPPDHWIESR